MDVKEESYRAFIAIEVPHDVQEVIFNSIKPIMSKLKPFVKWVSPENIHLTLRFLGQISLTFSNDLQDNMRKLTDTFSPLTFNLSEPGVFPSWREPRVLWVALELVQGDLFPLQKEIEALVQRLGLSPEKQRFHPHLTVGRAKSPTPVISALWKNVKIPVLPDFCVDKVTLFKSTLAQTGAIYEVMDVFPLNH